MKPSASTIPFKEALKFWTKLGFISFGGPAGQIAIMHQEVVDRKRWVGEDQFLRALNFCMLLPGPEAQQLATYIGWRLHGTLGGIAAGIAVRHPVDLRDAAAQLSRRGPHRRSGGGGGLLRDPAGGWWPWWSRRCCASEKRRSSTGYCMPSPPWPSPPSSSSRCPFRLCRCRGNALGGLIMQGRMPRKSSARATSMPQTRECRETVEAAIRHRKEQHRGRFLGHVVQGLSRSASVLWAAVPMGVIWACARGVGDTLTQIGLFFTKAAFVTFGGAYAVLSYITDVAVSSGWLSMRADAHRPGAGRVHPGPADHGDPVRRLS